MQGGGPPGGGVASQTSERGVNSEPAEPLDFRRMTVADAIRWLAEHGEPADPRTDVDPASLVRRFPRLAAVTTFDEEIGGPDGPVALRVYRDPTAVPTGRGLVWVHGGAFIGGTLDMPESDWFSRELASRGVPVVAVDYTKCLGDTHYPVPSDDVLAAWLYVHGNSERLLAVRPAALVLGGASAGGTLTAGAVERLRDGGQPLPGGLVLVYPAVHPNAPEASHVIDPSSHHGQLTLNFAGTLEACTDPHVFAGVGTGEGYPPTLVVVCENDDLRPSGERFAQTLKEAGVEVGLHLETGSGHGHINNPGESGAIATIGVVADWITKGLSTA